MCKHKPRFTTVHVCKTKFRLWKNALNNLKYVGKTSRWAYVNKKNSGLRLLLLWLLWRKVNKVWHRIDAASPVFEKPIARWITLCSWSCLCGVHGFYRNFDISDFLLNIKFEPPTAVPTVHLKGKYMTVFICFSKIISIVSPIRDGLGTHGVHILQHVVCLVAC